MLVYLGGPIDLACHHHDKESIAQAIADIGMTVFKPWNAYHAASNAEPEELGEHFRAANLSVIEKCDAMLAVLDARVMSYGTVVDIEHAVKMGVPVIVLIYDVKGRRPTYIPKETAVVGELSEALDWLRGVGSRGGLPAGEDGPLAVFRGALPVPVVMEPQHPIPYKAYPSDAGIDLYVHGNHSIDPGEWADIGTGTKMAIPVGYWGLILGRSSTFYKLGLQVHPAVIDAGYRGELRVSVLNPGEDIVFINNKDRLAQLILLPATNVVLHQQAPLPKGDRNEAGFGSSGK